MMNVGIQILKLQRHSIYSFQETACERTCIYVVENFVGHYHNSSGYIVSELPTPMWHDFSVPPCLTCGTFADRLVEIDLWMSGGGSKSVLHKVKYKYATCVLYVIVQQWAKKIYFSEKP